MASLSAAREVMYSYTTPPSSRMATAPWKKVSKLSSPLFRAPRAFKLKKSPKPNHLPSNIKALDPFRAFSFLVKGKCPVPHERKQKRTRRELSQIPVSSEILLSSSTRVIRVYCTSFVRVQASSWFCNL